MDEFKMEALLAQDEDTLRTTLRAGASVDKDRAKCVETLQNELGTLLLRYNAACAPDRTRQALADSMSAVARDTLGFLKAADAEIETGKRESSPWAPLLMMLAVILAAAALLIFRAAWPLMAGCAAALVLAFLAGRLWWKERRVQARATLDPEALVSALRRSCETMDRKIDEFCDKSQAWADEEKAAGKTDAQPLSGDALRLFGDLLEALYADSGELALKRLRQLPGYLHALGVEIEDYDGSNAEHFEFFPSRRGASTQRPALLADNRLLLSGRATEPTE